MKLAKHVVDMRESSSRFQLTRASAALHVLCFAWKPAKNDDAVGVCSKLITTHLAPLEKSAPTESICVSRRSSETLRCLAASTHTDSHVNRQIFARFTALRKFSFCPEWPFSRRSGGKFNIVNVANCFEAQKETPRTERPQFSHLRTGEIYIRRLSKAQSSWKKALPSLYLSCDDYLVNLAIKLLQLSKPVQG